MTSSVFTGPDWTEALRHLRESPRYHFSTWPKHVVPPAAAGVYAIWEGDVLMYVGMSGRSQSEETLRAHRETKPTKAKGLADRLRSHAAGRRSGDQFCVYVFDRLVLPALSQVEVAQAAAGGLSLDAKTRALIRERFTYSFVEVADGSTAGELERLAIAGGLGGLPPLLNPGVRRRRPRSGLRRTVRRAANVLGRRAALQQ